MQNSHAESRVKTSTGAEIDMSPAHWAIVCDILKRYSPQHAVWAFGSRVTGIAIITQQPLDLSTSANLAEAFAESDLPYKVDVVDWATTSAVFRKIINAGKLVLQNGSIT